MAYDLAKVTDNGNQLIAQILANKSSLSIDKIDVSDTQLSASTNIQTMTSISNVVQTIQANGYSKNSNSLIISTVLSNEGITADYKAWVFGIWGSDSTNGTSQLIAVITSTNSPDTVPAYSGTTPVELTYKFAIGFSNAINLSINMNSDSFATNDTVVHTTGDEIIDGQKKFDTDPTDSAGNAYAKTVDVNQQLDKKVVDNKDGTEQLNDVQIQPFNKLTDVEDHRNYLTGTANDLIISANASNFNYYRLFYPLVPGEKYTFSSEVALTGTANNVISVRVYQSDGNSNTTTINDAFVADGTRHSWTFVCPSNGYYLFVYAGVTGKTANIGATFHHSQLELGLPTPWHPSVLDKADDSTTLHNTGLGQITTDNSGIIVGNDGDFGIIKIQNHKAGIAIGSGNNFHFMTTSDAVLSNNSLYHDVWNIAPTGQISILGGAYFTPADDSKVAHNFGAEEIGGQKTFDIAPIDKTTGNPYITKDGVPSIPSDVARTGQAQTFTAAQTFSIAPTITDASTDKGDNQAATMADLKSLEANSWLKLDPSLVTINISSGNSNGNSIKLSGSNILYKLDKENKVLYLMGSLSISGQFDGVSTSTMFDIYFDFSNIASSLSLSSDTSIYAYGIDTLNDQCPGGYASVQNKNQIAFLSCLSSSFNGTSTEYIWTTSKNMMNPYVNYVPLS
ncbi:hypothetical protein [Lentilactobacillus hilgardii]|uniref:hypothetical protein n=1 Tax=Lentilactobacillus hilgardii TaxID=1588 RepID=UPI00390C51A4